MINVEGIRSLADSIRFVGSASLNIELTKNVNNIFNISNDITLQYSFEKNTFLFLNKFEFKEVNDKKFTNKRKIKISTRIFLNYIIIYTNRVFIKTLHLKVLFSFKKTKFLLSISGL